MNPNANDLFNAKLRYNILEDVIIHAILEATGIEDDVDSWPCDDFTFDDYDSSFEFKNTKLGWMPDSKAKDIWKSLGFKRCWVCYTDGSEVYIEF